MSRPRRPARPPHPMVADLSLPADPYTGRRVCARCGKPGVPGDAQHREREDLAAAARARDAAVLGERDDEQEG